MRAPERILALPCSCHHRLKVGDLSPTGNEPTLNGFVDCRTDNTEQEGFNNCRDLQRCPSNDGYDGILDLHIRLSLVGLALLIVGFAYVLRKVNLQA